MNWPVIISRTWGPFEERSTFLSMLIPNMSIHLAWLLRLEGPRQQWRWDTYLDCGVFKETARRLDFRENTLISRVKRKSFGHWATQKMKGPTKAQRGAPLTSVEGIFILSCGSFLFSGLIGPLWLFPSDSILDCSDEPILSYILSTLSVPSVLFCWASCDAEQAVIGEKKKALFSACLLLLLLIHLPGMWSLLQCNSSSTVWSNLPSSSPRALHWNYWPH